MTFIAVTTVSFDFTAIFPAALVLALVASVIRGRAA